MRSRVFRAGTMTWRTILRRDSEIILISIAMVVDGVALIASTRYLFVSLALYSVGFSSTIFGLIEILTPFITSLLLFIILSFRLFIIMYSKKG